MELDLSEERRRAMRREQSPEATHPKRRILIVDDHPLVRRGLIALIDNEPDLTVCASAGTHDAGLEAVASSRPDLVIADLSLGIDDGLAMVEEIHSGHCDLPVLVLSMHEAPVYARRALRAGARGYVTKQEMLETLLVAIRRVLDGEEFVSPDLRAGLDDA
jgi:DNA-binding NarL/FixJ family response regulator